MVLSTQLGKKVRLLMYVSFVGALAGCGGGAGDGPADVEPQNAILSDAESPVSANTNISPEMGTPEFTPILGVALPIQFQDPVQDVSVSTDYIDAQWQYMQTCLQVSAQEPIVLVVDGKLVPTGSNDDVVRHIDGQVQASSHVTSTGTTIQVRAEDLDGSLGRKGSYVRSIMGRYLWLANSLPERDYPYACAQGESQTQVEFSPNLIVLR